jgi:hypothetical protein
MKRKNKSPNRPKDKKCFHCDKDFIAPSDKTKFCSTKCRRTSYITINKDKLKADAYKWNANNPLKRKEIKLKRYYGMTVDTYYKMNEDQKEVCKICGNKCMTGRELSVDHCHKTGKIRGLLCSKCNSGLGSFQDNVENMLKAIEYLKESHGDSDLLGR